MDKDFDKLQEFVEIMKVSIYWALSTAGTILEVMKGDTRPCPAATYSLVGRPKLYGEKEKASTKLHDNWS